MSGAWALIGIYIWHSMLLSFHLTVIIFHFIQQCDFINELSDLNRSHYNLDYGQSNRSCGLLQYIYFVPILRWKGFSITNIIFYYCRDEKYMSKQIGLLLLFDGDVCFLIQFQINGFKTRFRLPSFQIQSVTSKYAYGVCIDSISTKNDDNNR